LNIGKSYTLGLMGLLLIHLATSKSFAEQESIDTVTAIKSGVRLVGRWKVEEDQARCQWPSCGLEFHFEGTELEISLEDSASGAPHEVAGFQSNYVDIVVEGFPRRVLQLKNGKHRYEIFRSTEVKRRLIMIWKRTESSVGWIAFHGLHKNRDGVITPLKVPAKRMGVYGDSDACGYGVEVDDRHAHFAPATENAEKAFAVEAIKALDFDLQLIAASGWGIMRGYGGEPELAIPRVARRVFIDSESPLSETKPPPDLIVVMLGDNDFHLGDPGKAFDEAYRSFVDQLRSDYPLARIILCVGTSMVDKPEKAARTRLTQVIDSIATHHNAKEPSRPTVYRLDITPYQESEGYGADWHTSAAGHRRIAKEIDDFVRKEIIWP
jgi:hypothetical protein